MPTTERATTDRVAEYMQRPYVMEVVWDEDYRAVTFPELPGLAADGEYVRAFDLGKLPPTIVTDWASPLLDGDLPLDMSIDVEPLDLAWAKLQLDTRRNALESSAPRLAARWPSSR